MYDVLLITTLPISHKKPTMYSYDPADDVSPSLALAYLASSLREAGYKVKIYDSTIELYPDYLWKNLKQDIASIKSKLIGINVHATCSYNNSLKLAQLFKKQNPNSVITLGGLFVTFMDEMILRDSEFIDIVVRGEGEKTIVELANSIIRNNLHLSKIKGITYRDNQKIIRNSDRELLETLDSLPLPAWDLFPIKKIKKLSRSGIPIGTSRGCAGQCAFCADPIFWKKRVRFRDPRQVFNELQIMSRNFNVNRFNFTDNNFGFNRKNTKRLCKEIKKNNLGLTWSADIRADSINKEIAPLLKEAGCTDILLGIESGSSTILEIVKKGVSLDKIYNAVKILNAVGIKIDGSCIIGLPGENYRTFAETIKFVSNLDLDSLSFFPFIPFPGCNIWFAPDKYGIKIESFKWSKYIEPFVIIRTNELSSKEIKSLWHFARAYALEITPKAKRYKSKHRIIEQIEKGYLITH